MTIQEHSYNTIAQQINWVTDAEHKKRLLAALNFIYATQKFPYVNGTEWDETVNEEKEHKNLKIHIIGNGIAANKLLITLTVPPAAGQNWNNLFTLLRRHKNAILKINNIRIDNRKTAIVFSSGLAVMLGATAIGVGIVFGDIGLITVFAAMALIPALIALGASISLYKHSTIRKSLTEEWEKLVANIPEIKPLASDKTTPLQQNTL